MQAPAPLPVWIFAYGSLLWRPDFQFVEAVPAHIRGWSRRFWQGSPDHRGVPGAPGRVVTLTPAVDEVCWGLGYRLDETTREATLQSLDVRERGGYERHVVELHGKDADLGSVPAYVYVASPTNPHYLGPSALGRIADQIRRAHGPSGSNLDYVLRLDSTLRALGIRDEHVGALAALLQSPGLGAAEA
jgi:glutathione-specific gamma-glutamylcyclotransferase